MKFSADSMVQEIRKENYTSDYIKGPKVICTTIYFHRQNDFGTPENLLKYLALVLMLPKHYDCSIMDG